MFYVTQEDEKFQKNNDTRCTLDTLEVFDGPAYDSLIFTNAAVWIL